MSSGDLNHRLLSKSSETGDIGWSWESIQSRKDSGKEDIDPDIPPQLISRCEVWQSSSGLTVPIQKNTPICSPSD